MGQSAVESTSQCQHIPCWQMALTVQCVCRAGLLPLLISAVGKDAAGSLLLGQWQQLGLSTEGVHVLPGLCTPSVSIIFDSGECRAAIHRAGYGLQDGLFQRNCCKL